MNCVVIPFALQAGCTHTNTLTLTSLLLKQFLTCLSLCTGLQVSGGWLWQGADALKPEDITFTPVSETKPTPEQVLFGFEHSHCDFLCEQECVLETGQVCV